MKNKICCFEENINELRKELDNSLNGKELDDDFFVKLEEIKKEENEILKDYIEDFNKIEFEKCNIIVKTKEILNNISELNKVNSLTELEKDKIEYITKSSDYNDYKNDDLITSVFKNENYEIRGFYNGDIEILTESSKKIHIFNSEIVSIDLTGTADIIAISDKGEVAVIGNEIFIFKYDDNIFKKASDNINILLLGESGSVYYIRKFKDKYVKYKKPLLTDYSAINIVNEKDNIFLTLKLDENIEEITISNVMSIDELWAKPFFGED